MTNPQDLTVRMVLLDLRENLEQSVNQEKQDPKVPRETKEILAWKVNQESLERMDPKVLPELR